MTITLYPAIVYDNNLSLDHGGSEVDEACEQIYNATKGWGVSRTCFFFRVVCLSFDVVCPSEKENAEYTRIILILTLIFVRSHLYMCIVCLY
jgi:hypothetical protein